MTDEQKEILIEFMKEVGGYEPNFQVWDSGFNFGFKLSVYPRINLSQFQELSDKLKIAPDDIEMSFGNATLDFLIFTESFGCGERT